MQIVNLHWIETLFSEKREISSVCHDCAESVHQVVKVKGFLPFSRRCIEMIHKGWCVIKLEAWYAQNKRPCFLVHVMIFFFMQ